MLVSRSALFRTLMAVRARHVKHAGGESGGREGL